MQASLEDVFIARLEEAADSRTVGSCESLPVCARYSSLIVQVVTPLVDSDAGSNRRSRRALTLDEALARAAATSHRLAELRARESAAAAVLSSARRPTCRRSPLQAGYQRTNHVDEFRVLQPEPIASESSIPTCPTTGARGSTCSGRSTPAAALEALERAADAERQASGKDVDSARSDLRLETTRAFWALVTATEAVRVVSESVTRIEAQLRDVRSAVRRRVPAAKRRAHRRDAGVARAARC